jgi:membrane-anchored protein YejM (alkaline phosphatase superfamily)
MSPGLRTRDAEAMKKTLFISVIAIVLLVLAVGGWTVKGLRRASRAGRSARPAFA